jgi:signal transduction histidine kinase
MDRMDAAAPPWTARPGIADLAIAGVCAALGIGGVIAEVLSSGGAPQLVLGGAALAVLAGAALLWRRRAPQPVALTIIGCCLIYHALGYPGLAPAVAMYPAVYTVAAQGLERRLWLAVGLIVAIGLIPLLPPLPATYNLGALTGPEISMVVAVAVGETARTRRVAAADELRAVQRAAAEQQRRRLLEQRLGIAREVHDVLAHTITVITVQAAAAADALDGRPDEARAALAEVRRAARDASAELRGTLRLLRGEPDAGAPAPPPNLAPPELAPPSMSPPEVSPPRPGMSPETGVAPPQPGLAQLPDLARRSGAGGIEITLDTAGEPATCSPALELAVYRVVQEALTNAVRHSRADAAHVRVELGRDEIRVEVTDEGTGRREPPPTSTSGTAGHGLIGMRERVLAFGGTLDAGPLPPPRSGFRVFARLPAHPTKSPAPKPSQRPAAVQEANPAASVAPVAGGTGDPR